MGLKKFLGTWEGAGEGEWHAETFRYRERVVWRALPREHAFYVESVARIDGDVSHGDVTLVSPRPRGGYSTRVLVLNGALEEGRGALERGAFTWTTKVTENRPRKWPIDHVRRRHRLVGGKLVVESWLSWGPRFAFGAHTRGTLHRKHR
ncbi:MAG: heme-binding beta-barrel domain-containing protein [Thermoplasmatota archaeon]